MSLDDEAYRQNLERIEHNRRKAAESAALRLKNEAIKRAKAQEVAVSLYLLPDGNKLVTIPVTAGSTVAELSEICVHECSFPLVPRLFTGDKALPRSAILLDLNFGEEQDVMAELVGILTTSKDCTAKIWNAATCENVLTLRGHQGTVCTIRATSDLKWAVTASEDHTAKVWAIDRCQKGAWTTYTLGEHEAAVTSADFCTDQKFIVTSSLDGTAKVWSMRDGTCVRTFEKVHIGGVFSARFEGSASHVRTTGRDKLKDSTKIWEVASGRCIENLPFEAEYPSVSPDGTSVLTLDGSSIVYICAAPAGCDSTLLQPDGSARLPALATSEDQPPRTLQGHTGEVTSALYIKVKPDRAPPWESQSPRSPGGRRTPRQQ